MRLSSVQAADVKPPIISASNRGPKPFSTLVTVLYTLGVAGVLLYMTTGYWARASRLENLWYPEETANWVATVNMEVYEGMQQLPRALQNACKVAYVDRDDLPRECRKILRETLDFLSARGGATEQVSAQLAVLLAETGSKTEAMRLVDSLQDTRAFDFRQGFRAVYGDNTARDLTNRTDNTPLNYMDSSWSAWRFKTRWHRATGATSDADWNEEWVGKRARKKAAIVFLISSLMVVIIAVGLALLPWLLRSRPSRFFDANSNSSFSFGEGFGIFVRAEFWGWLLVLLFSLNPLTRLPVLAFGVMTAAPFVALLALRHWRYGRGSLASFLGIPDRSGDGGRWLEPQFAFSASTWRSPR